MEVKKISRKKGQVWVETVLYTLIGLALIGVVLAIITPKINETRDRISVEQTIESLNLLDERIGDVLDRGVGNIRVIPSFTIKRGEMFVNSSADKIVFIIEDLGRPYSEIGVPIKIGRVEVLSQESRSDTEVRLTLSYGSFANLTYAKRELTEKFTPSSTPYKFSIQNLGDKNGDGVFVVDLEEISRR